MSVSKMGSYLRDLGGGPVEVMLRVSDFALRADAEKQIGGAGQELVAFVAANYREVSNGDLWEFEVNEQSSTGPRRMRVAISGEDILMIRVEGRVAS